LTRLGLEKDDRLGIWSPNRYEWIVTQFASALAGLILVNVNPMYKTEELSYAIDRVGIKALLAPPSFRRSNYYKTLIDIIPDMSLHAEGKSNLDSHSFPKLKHIIIFDSVDGKAYRLVTKPTKNKCNSTSISNWRPIYDLTFPFSSLSQFLRLNPKNHPIFLINYREVPTKQSVKNMGAFNATFVICKKNKHFLEEHGNTAMF
jgi:hypothetical protein